MKRLSESFEQNELTNYLRECVIKEEVPITEGKLSELFSKAYNYLRGKIAQIGKFFVALWNDEILPAVVPVTSQKAWLTGSFKDADAVHMVGTAEDKKFSGVPTNGKDVIDSRPSTLDILRDKVARGIKYESRMDLMNQNLITEEIKLTHSDEAFAKLNLDTPALQTWVRMCLKNPLRAEPLLIWGAPGIGKTQIVKAVLKEVMGANARLIDVQLSLKEYDDFFLPAFVETNGEKEATDLPKSWLPVYKVTGNAEKDKAANEACGTGLIFFDELSRAKPQVMNVCLKIIGERMLGEDYRIGDGWAIIAASNRMEDDENTNNELSTALGNRFMQINYAPTYKTWKKWADTKQYMNRDILNWLECNEQYFYYNPNTKNGDQTLLYASPRTWEKACRTLANFAAAGEDEGFDIDTLPDEIIEQVIAAAVGSNPAAAFMEFLKLKRTVDINSLKKVWTDSDKVKLPERKGNTYKQDLLWIITTQIISFKAKQQPTPDEFMEFCKYYARLNDESAMAKALNDLFRIHVKMNLEIEPGEGKYYPGIKLLVDAYPDFDKLDWENEKFKSMR